MKRVNVVALATVVLSVSAVVLLAVLMITFLTGCSKSQTSEPAQEFASVSDSAQIDRVVIRDIFPQLNIALPNWYEKYQQARQDALSATEVDESEYIAELDYYEAYNGSQSPTYNGNANGLNSFDGVYSYGGHLETYYASYAAYDNQLWVDDEGFFRNSDGRYVVSTDDYAQGEIIEISKGEAIVMDCSTAPGVVDVHTTWGR